MTVTPPIACRPETLTAQEDRARRALFESLRPAIVAESATDRGVSWKITKTEEALAAAAELVALEGRCCPFLALRIEVDSSEPAFTLALTGPEGTAELLRRELGA